MKGKVSVAVIVVAAGVLGGFFLWAQSGGRIILEGDHKAFYEKIAVEEEEERRRKKRQADRTFWNDFLFRHMGGPWGSMSLPDEDDIDDFDEFDDEALGLPDPGDF